MRFEQLIPPGDAASAEALHTGLRLGERASQERPHVVCNFVSTLDGKAAVGGRTRPISDDADRLVFHLLRTQADAVLVGTNTLRIERYGPLVRDERFAAVRADVPDTAAAPLAVVVSRSGNVPYDIPLFADPDGRVAVYAARAATPPRGCRATLHHHPHEPDDGLAPVLRSLRDDHDVRSLLCEGGPRLMNALLAEDLVDELFLTVSPAFAGGGEIAVTEGPPLERARAMRLVRALSHGDELFLRYERARDDDTA